MFGSLALRELHQLLKLAHAAGGARFEALFDGLRTLLGALPPGMELKYVGPGASALTERAVDFKSTLDERMKGEYDRTYAEELKKLTDPKAVRFEERWAEKLQHATEKRIST